MGSIVTWALSNGLAESKLRNKSIEYAEALKYNEFSELKEALIEKEVDSFLRSSFSEQISWLNSEKADVPQDHPKLLAMIELFERRNCLVHSGGLASKLYVENTRKLGSDVKIASLGEKLRPTDDYIKNTFTNIVVFSSMMFIVIWSKAFKKHDEQWETMLAVLHDTVYRLMKQHNYLTARELLRFIHNDLGKFEIGETDRKLMKVNLALCEQRTGDERRALEILDSEDWRSTTYNFRSSVAFIRGEQVDGLECIRKGFAGGDVTKVDLIEWPVFETARATPEFKVLFEELFGAGSADSALIDSERPKPLGEKVGKLMADAFAMMNEGKASHRRKASAKKKPSPETAAE